MREKPVFGEVGVFDDVGDIGGKKCARRRVNLGSVRDGFVGRVDGKRFGGKRLLRGVGGSVKRGLRIRLRPDGCHLLRNDVHWDYLWVGCGLGRNGRPDVDDDAAVAIDGVWEGIFP